MSEEFKHVGKHVRRERLKYGLSLNDLARETDISASFLSLLENGKVTPSLKVLDKLAKFFSINIAALVAEDDEEDEDQIFVFRRDDQIRVSSRNERTLRFLLPKVGLGIEPVLVTLRPRVTSTPLTQHPGYEFGYVLEGVLQIQVGEKEPVTVHQGDSVIYQSSYPHRLLNPGDKTAKGLWIGLPYAQGIHFTGRRIVFRPANLDPLLSGRDAEEAATAGGEGHEE
ncbi:MAG TPA: cupin domain-containing protein [Firmicutes bacterium]|nr:cupin domain-containing protein [Bacillota bacterium]